MATRHLLHLSVSVDIKRRVRAAAAADFITPSAWLRRAILRALESSPSAHVTDAIRLCRSQLLTSARVISGPYL
jgi:hypothetical protein